jgi:hypothetical protein
MDMATPLLPPEPAPAPAAKHSKLDKFIPVQNSPPTIVLWRFAEYLTGKWNHKSIMLSIKKALNTNYNQ